MAQDNRGRGLLRIGSITVAVFVLIAALFLSGVFETAERLLYDRRMFLTAPQQRPSEDIAVILIDQDSIDWGAGEFGWAWPWERRIYGDIVRFFQLGGAASVTFDMLYTETSVYGKADDQAFADACSEYGRVVLPVYFGETPQLPVEPIRSAVAAVGSINARQDSDGVVRRAVSYDIRDKQIYPSLVTALLETAGDDVSSLYAEPESGRLLRFQRDIGRYVPYSAAQILQSYYALLAGEEPLLEPEQFAGMYVLFGVYAPGLFDICTTPVSAVYPGVGVHVTQLDNVLQNAFLTQLPPVFELLLIFLGALLGCMPLCVAQMISLKKTGIIICAAVVLFIAAVFGAVSVYVFAQGIVLPVVTPLTALFAGFVCAAVVGYITEGRQRQYIKNAFRQYLSPAVIEQLIEHPEQLRLGGEKRHISIYFSDVQGFTSISERLEPDKLTALLNDYLSEMTDIILASGGTVDKYEGDAVIAFWSAPLEMPDHAARALEAAVACQERLAELRPRLESSAGGPFYMRIGLNTGDAVVGNMGSSKRFDYTMLGDSVNLAARLEGLNKQFGTYTMCSAASKNEAQQTGTKLCFRELARAAVVGKKEAVTVYEPMTGEMYEKKRNIIEVFEKALHLYYEGRISEALNLFEQIQNQDPPAQRYALKCQSLGCAIINDNSWQGIWVADSK